MIEEAVRGKPTSEDAKSTGKTASKGRKLVDKRKTLGVRGENAAYEYLVRRHGFKILERNWRCGYGEADIIALDRLTLVFCEVKTRRGPAAVAPEESITPSKVERYNNIARVYRSRCTTRHTSLRFDLITIVVNKDDEGALLKYYPNARGFF